MKWYVVFTYCLDFIFFLDIIVNFFSAYQNEVFKMIDDRKVIACTYLKGWFVIDLIAIVPFDLIMNAMSAVPDDLESKLLMAK